MCRPRIDIETGAVQEFLGSHQWTGFSKDNFLGKCMVSGEDFAKTNPLTTSFLLSKSEI
jgi:hypothetical protein